MTDRTRRPRGAAKGNPVVYGHVVPEAKDVVSTTADALGISQAQAIEAILLSLSLDADGVPSTIDRSRFHREELPIPAA
jgi:isopentenyl phosphate kinase